MEPTCFMQGGQTNWNGEETIRTVLENLLFNERISEKVQITRVSWEQPGKKLAGNLTGIIVKLKKNID